MSVWYPRTATVDGKEVLVKDDEVVTYRQHLSQEKRILFFTGAITGEINWHDLLLGMDTLSQDPIKAFIASCGGELDVALMVYDTMRMIQSPVITIGRYCVSAAVFLLAAGSKRYLFPHARIMIHLPSMGMEQADSRAWEARNKLMQEYKDLGPEILKECGAKKSKKQILKDMEDEHWMTAQEAIDYGLADEILTPEAWTGFLK